MAVALNARAAAAMAATLLALGWTSPAQALGPTAPFSPPGAASAPVADTSLPGAAPVAAQPGLAGLRLGSTRLALIDGEWRQIGQAVRGAKLSAITARGATLTHPDGHTEQLLLVPTDSPIPNPLLSAKASSK